MCKYDLTQRIELLGCIFDAVGGEIVGRKRVQKLIYILQSIRVIPKIYEYSWNHYGVYSPEIAQDIEQGEWLGLFREDEIPGSDYSGYKTRLNNMQGWNLKKFPSKKQKLIQEINSLDVRLLEVISSIIYFKEKGHTEDEIKNLLSVYKGHLRRFFREAYDWIKNNGFS